MSSAPWGRTGPGGVLRGEAGAWSASPWTPRGFSPTHLPVECCPHSGPAEGLRLRPRRLKPSQTQFSPGCVWAGCRPLSTPCNVLGIEDGCDDPCECSHRTVKCCHFPLRAGAQQGLDRLVSGETGLCSQEQPGVLRAGRVTPPLSPGSATTRVEGNLGGLPETSWSLGPASQRSCSFGGGRAW